jgi:hypothetical protein
VPLHLAQIGLQRIGARERDLVPLRRRASGAHRRRRCAPARRRREGRRRPRRGRRGDARHAVRARPRAARRRPGPREDPARLVAGEGARPLFGRVQFTPDLLPADITGTDVLHEEEGDALVRFSPGPDLPQPGARRRDQPHPAEDAGRAARGHAGAQGHRGHEDARAARPVPGLRDAQPDRARGHLPAARGAARSLPARDPRRLPVRSGGARDRAAHHLGQARR